MGEEGVDDEEAIGGREIVEKEDRLRVNIDVA